MSIQAFPLLPIHYHSNDGTLLGGGKLYFYEAGTPDTIRPVYTDHTGAVEYTQPVILDTRGEPPTEGIYGSDTASYKIVLKDKNGVTLKTVDGFVFPSGTGGEVISIHNNLSGRQDTDSHPISAITGLEEELALFANESGVVHNFGNESINGVKTFNEKPVVPNASFTIAKTTGLQAALDLKADISDLAGFALDADVVHKTGDETIEDRKTFDSITGNSVIEGNDIELTGAEGGKARIHAGSSAGNSSIVSVTYGATIGYVAADGTQVLGIKRAYNTPLELVSSIQEIVYDSYAEALLESGNASLPDYRSIRTTVSAGADSVVSVFTGDGVHKDFKYPTDMGGTIATTESETIRVGALLDEKQTVFPGVCQIQYLTENDIEFDFTGAIPLFKIKTVKNGTTISASNPLCFFTDGSGIVHKWTFATAKSIPMTYTLGAWWIYANDSGVIVADQSAIIDFSLTAPIARVYIDPSLTGNARNVTMAVEFHKNDISASDHLWKHQNAGTIHISGLDFVGTPMPITSAGVPTSSPNVSGVNTCVSITSGVTLDENLQVNILNSTTPAMFSQDLGNVTAGSITVSNSAQLKISYSDAVGTLKMLPATRFPFPFNASTNIPEYITTAGVRTSVVNKSWIVNYIYSFQDPRYGEVIKVRSSNAGYLTYTDALAANWSDLQAVFITLRDKEIRPQYKVIHYVEHSLGGAYSALVKYSALVHIDDIRKQSVIIPPSAVGSVLASGVSYIPTAPMTSTNVQSVIDLECIHTKGVDQTITSTGIVSMVRSTVGVIAKWLHGSVEKLSISDTAITASVQIVSTTTGTNENNQIMNAPTAKASYLSFNGGLTAAGSGFIGKGSPSNDIMYLVNFQNGIYLQSSGVERLGINDTDITARVPIVHLQQTPASATAPGIAGTICADANYIYHCTATNVWKRIAIATW